ncbi:hypothetical protein B0A55_00158 [Friedmanniomyces simplex]|uniref:U6 snRNA phosphodiesterase n=1 Tax=Friedmanniomyces simplex TaxID=329884 RepID=A0A4U0Y3T5_9PEZI|nr:hypothetical protein B0A55_00158 [Friedmanniomyces simplex]
MSLVAYSDSESDDTEAQTPPPSKKRRLESEPVKELPPLPDSFRDLYSSTVRTSTQDDPSLHGGRKRVTPHVEGNWPTHVYLEWNPEPRQYQLLSALIAEEQASKHGKCKVRSLLHNELGVNLPLHVSLSRPLVLQTEQKEPVLNQLKQGITSSGVRAFQAGPARLRWHPNELGTRWFLVLQLRMPEKGELQKLLSACNKIAAVFDQPLLYNEAVKGPHPTEAEHEGSKADGKFHVSIAWSLSEPKPADPTKSEQEKSSDRTSDERLTTLSVAFAEVKVRIGQDVCSIPLPPARVKQGLFG